MAEPSESLYKAAFKTKSQKLFRGLRSRLFPWIADSSTVYGLRRVLLQLIWNFLTGASWQLKSTSKPSSSDSMCRGRFHSAGIVAPWLRGFCIRSQSLGLLHLGAMLAGIPRHGPMLTNQVQHAGFGSKSLAESKFAEVFSSDPAGARPATYL